MPIEFRCANCGQKFRVKDEAAGKKATCKSCGAILRVPADAGDDAARDDVFAPPASPAPEADDEEIGFACPHCQGTIGATADLAGETIECPYCGEEATVPDGRPAGKTPLPPALEEANEDIVVRTMRAPARQAAPIEFQCILCATRISAPAHLAGKEIRCPSCQERLAVPTYSESASSERVRSLAEDTMRQEARTRAFLVGLVVVAVVLAGPIVFLRATKPTWLNARLAEAAKKGQTWEVRALLLCGADANLSDKDGVPLYAKAAQEGHKATADLLRKVSPPPDLRGIGFMTADSLEVPSVVGFGGERIAPKQPGQRLLVLVLAVNTNLFGISEAEYQSIRRETEGQGDKVTTRDLVRSYQRDRFGVVLSTGATQRAEGVAIWSLEKRGPEFGGYGHTVSRFYQSPDQVEQEVTLGVLFVANGADCVPPFSIQLDQRFPTPIPDNPIAPP